MNIYTAYLQREIVYFPIDWFSRTGDLSLIQ